MKKDDFTIFSMIVIAIAACIFIFNGVQLGSTKSPYYYFLIAAAIPCLFILLRLNKIRKLNFSLSYIRSNYGQVEKRKRDINKIEKFFIFKGSNGSELNKQTFSDLDLNKFFEVMDRTHTTPGEERLYDMLRRPILNKEDIKKRREKIEFLKENKKIREKIEANLFDIYREGRGSNLLSLLLEDLKVDKKYYFLYNLGFFLSIFSLILLCLSFNNIMFFNIKYVALFVTLTLILNVRLHKMDLGGSSAYSASAAYLCKVLSGASTISKLNVPELSEYIDILKKNSGVMKFVMENSGTLGRLQGMDFFSDYMNIIFLSGERSFFKISDSIIKNREELLKIYEIVGELDALISISSFEKEYGNFVETELTNSKEGFINTVNLVHPLVKSPIGNSIDIHKDGIIITGSNMSGKSTFLRTVGINMVLAETLGIAFAESFKGSFMKICSSINPGDNLLEGKSYYLGEAESIHDIINTLNEEIPTLSLIDEIFRGTNPVERVNAAAEIMDYLRNNNAVSFVATHDLQIASMVNGYKCYYFTENVDENGLKFDYHMREGISPTRNAVKLLEYIGYPKNIINKINERIANEVNS